MAFVRQHILHVMMRGFVIAQNCSFAWLTQKDLQVPLPTLKPVKENLQGRFFFWCKDFLFLPCLKLSQHLF